MSLKKNLTLLDVFCIITGAMVSSGLFVLPGIAHAEAGPAVVFSYCFAGLLAAAGMLSIAEIITAMPKAGGDYFYVMRTMGPSAGTVMGLLSWFSLTMKSAFALMGMAAFIRPLTPVNPLLIAGGICIFFMVLNCVGVGEASRFQILLVFGLFALMGYYIASGVPSIQIEYFVPFAPYGWDRVLATAGLVFVSYGGLLKAASVAEEVKNPGMTIPLGMILALVIVCMIYTIMVFTTSGVLGADELDRSLTPISDGASVFLGRSGLVLMNIAAALAFISTANAGIMAASRYLLSLSRDGLLPSAFGKTNSRFQTPHSAVMLTGLCMIGALFIQLDVLIKTASTVLILTHILANLCLIILRESRLLNYQPKFRAPLYPYLQIAGMLGCTLLLFEMGRDALLISLVLIGIGLFVYWFYGRINTEREFALVHLVARITNREVPGEQLETELKQIIRERDHLCKDRFDQLIEEAIVFDIPGPHTRESFFAELARKLRDCTGFDSEEIMQALLSREAAGSTVIMHGIAVSDIMIKGKEVLSIVLVRCRGGITLNPDDKNIHAFFLLLASEAERSYNLRAVTAIAQIIQNPQFEKRWLAAKNTAALRDVILLSERRRICSPHRWNL